MRRYVHRLRKRTHLCLNHIYLGKHKVRYLTITERRMSNLSGRDVFYQIIATDAITSFPRYIGVLSLYREYSFSCLVSSTYLFFSKFPNLRTILAMNIGNMLVRLRLWFRQLLSGSEKRPKIPRKKLSMQFKQAKSEFQEQVNLLEQTVSRPDLARSTIMLGKLLLQDVRRFQELHIIRINENRLKTIAKPFLHPVDFSMWVINQMYAYTEEIYHYLKTVEDVEL